MISLHLQQVRCIWHQGAHNAFTDLASFNGALWCVFREASDHVSGDGILRLLRSEDGEDWCSVAIFSHPHADLRDAKLLVSPQNTLLLFGTAAFHDRQFASHQTYLWQSDDGVHWREATPVGEKNIWLWRLAWQQQTLYGLGYHVASPRFVRLYQSTRLPTFRPVGDSYQGTYANESALLFPSCEQALCLLRRDPENGLFGRSRAPFTDWHWQDVGCRIGGPQWVQLSQGPLLCCVRLYEPDVRTSLCWVDSDSGQLSEALTLPSAGDCSYAGMVQQRDRLYISYYSSHESHTAVYLASVSLTNTTVEK